MKIIAPIRNKDQYEPLVRNGASELYGSLYSVDWFVRYGEMIEYNRRGNFGKQANFTSFADMAKVLEWCERDDVTFFLTVNAIFLSVFQTDTLRSILSEYVKGGGSRVIVSDMQAMKVAQEEGCKITVSSCAGIYNGASAAFWCGMGAERIILPRSADITSLPYIMAECPDGTESEVFIMNTMCKYSDSMCRSFHNSEKGALCHFYDDAPKKYFNADCEELRGRNMESMLRNSFFYRQLFSGNCSLGCGQCAVWDLMRARVNSVKIVGRLLDTGLLARQVALTKRNIGIAEMSQSREEYMARMEDPRAVLDADLCSRGYRCYYRDVRRMVELNE